MNYIVFNISQQIAHTHSHFRKQLNTGHAYVESVDITAASFRMRVTSAKAKKFKNKETQVKALHLDVEFYQFDKEAVRGVLPELWGLVPISKATEKLLKKPQ